MKLLFQPSFRIFSLYLLCLFCVCMTTEAQDSIVVYSDTTSALIDAEPNDSLWNTSAPSGWQDDFFPDNFTGNGIFNLMSGLMGFTGIIAVLFGLLFFLFPLLAIALIIYLIYRLNREKQRNREYASPKIPENDAERKLKHKEHAIRQVCWGVGLILVEWIADVAEILYIIGIVFICMAAFNWLSLQIRK